MIYLGGSPLKGGSLSELPKTACLNTVLIRNQSFWGRFLLDFIRRIHLSKHEGFQHETHRHWKIQWVFQRYEKSLASYSYCEIHCFFLWGVISSIYHLDMHWENIAAEQEVGHESASHESFKHENPRKYMGNGMRWGNMKNPVGEHGRVFSIQFSMGEHEKHWG